MKKAVRLLLILFLALSLNGCDTWDDWFGDDDDDDDEVTVAVESTAAKTTSSATTASTASSDDSTTAVAATTAVATAGTSGSETATWFGTTNNGLPTWYFSKPMGAYPSVFTIQLPACGTATVNNNGHRWTGLGCILKQSEVASRGMGLICTGCWPKSGTVSW